MTDQEASVPDRQLKPAQHVLPPPSGGWSGADVSEDELVDDQHIADDPDSYVLEPEAPDGP